MAISVLTQTVSDLMQFTVPVAGGFLARYLNTKHALAKAEKFATTHQNYLTAAREAWNMVEVEFKNNTKLSTTADAKRNSFEKDLLIKIPALKSAQVTSLRKTVEGELHLIEQSVAAGTTLQATGVAPYAHAFVSDVAPGIMTGVITTANIGTGVIDAGVAKVNTASGILQVDADKLPVGKEEVKTIIEDTTKVITDALKTVKSDIINEVGKVPNAVSKEMNVLAADVTKKDDTITPDDVATTLADKVAEDTTVTDETQGTKE
jgi:hypothetical protein